MRRALLVSFLCLTLLTGCAAKPAPAGPEPIPGATATTPGPGVNTVPGALKPEQVAVVRYLFGGPPGEQVPRPLFGARAEDRPWLERLLHGLATAPATDPTGANSQHRRVSWLELVLTDGRTIRLREAWDCRPEGSGGTHCTTVPGKQVIEADEKQRVVASPELDAFLHADFAQAMPLVEKMRVQPREVKAGGTVTVEGDGWGRGTRYEIALKIGDQRFVLDRGGLDFGHFAWSGRLPGDVPAGEHQLDIDVQDEGGYGFPIQVTR